MPVTKWLDIDPEPGSPVVIEYSDPALADRLVHFVGRQRGATPVPPHVATLSTEQRLANILTTGQLFGFPVYGSQQVPVASLSDLSAAELESAFSRGLNRRGPVEPWALVLDRNASWQVGFRPVVYADAAYFDQYRACLETIHGAAWAALAVRTEMQSDDWTAEREWRYCFASQQQRAIDVRHGVAAVIVGRSGWTPYLLSDRPSALPPMRWLWDAAQSRLLHDGRVPLW